MEPGWVWDAPVPELILKVNGARIRGTERFDGFGGATRTRIVESLLVICSEVCETGLCYTLES